MWAQSRQRLSWSVCEGSPEDDNDKDDDDDDDQDDGDDSDVSDPGLLSGLWSQARLVYL